ncbi:cytochrome c1 [Echinimonas agarilytica]|uniref:Cytochrome c1 n=1 Tax=Echinimonas agarilytica TaxID=1215918 RepID=A0AA41W4L2_9GAMM|nr:cytochrome c1 [Echinimonas agarilytica]MCM2678633.1 cytochrome c1 [Echinimonas agarilytica]
MKSLILVLSLLMPSMALAAGSSVPLDHANVDLSDKASLQRGAKLFMNYCFGCHSTQYQRYERVATDLGIPIPLMQEHLVVTGVKVGELMENSVEDSQAEKWFGAAPPDLTLVSRVRGADWIYTYLRGFYVDETRPFGVNNVVFPSVGMPHVLEELQGIPTKHYETRLVDGEEKQVYLGIQTDGSGEMSVDEYDRAVLDLVNFLKYSAEPIALERQRMGYWVLGFLFILLIISYFLKKEFWRDVH